MMKTIYHLVGLSLSMALLLPIKAQATPANMLLYIHPQEYAHSVKLWEYFNDYWFKQGPAVEPVATELLSEAFGQVAMCTANSEGNMLVWLQPKMYFNPQLKVFHGEITANAYRSDGAPVASYIGKARKVGFLDVAPQQQIEMVYKMAMEKLVATMRQDENLKSLAAEGQSNANAGAACALVASFPPPKIIDSDYFLKGIH